MNLKRLAILISPFALYYLGWGLNVLVLSTNGGAFPVVPCVITQGVAPGVMIDDIHRVMQHSDHFKMFADWIQVKTGVMSIGDVCLELGDWLQIPAIIAYFTLCLKDIFPTL